MRRLSLLLLLVGACTTVQDTAPSTTVPPTTVASATTAATGAPPDTSALAEVIVPLGSAIYDPDAVPEPGPIPVAVTIDRIRVDSAPVVPVGVEENGELEIPGASDVGWYRFGPTPGEAGSSVLAAHVAFNGRDGVFRRLASVEPGSIVRVDYDDGSTTTHVITEVAQYRKDELPLERVFSNSGDPVLTLITCGGDFNRSLNVYDDNIVAYAAPLEG